jgi:glycosyltransferase involved in cell wall biosynthesis
VSRDGNASRGADILKVLHVTPAYYPATFWGGPITSLLGLCTGLASRPDIVLRVLTTDSAGPDLKQRIERRDFPIQMPPGYDVYYCRRRLGSDIAPGMFLQLVRLVYWADIVHLTAVYSFPTIPALAICALFRRPVVWSPRGALQPWGENRRSSAKWLWRTICHGLVSVNKTAMHVTSVREAQESAERFKGQRFVTIPNSVDVPPRVSRSRPNPEGPLRILYLGRLHPIKGIENLLVAISHLKDLKVELSVYGEGTPAYVCRLKRQILSLELAGIVALRGHVDGAARERAFEQADLCVVPSYSENFGMVVAEALAREVPVIAATGTPWQMIDRVGCGRWIDNDAESIAKSIREMSSLPLNEMGRRGREFVINEFSINTIAGSMRELYKSVIDQARSNRSMTR